MQDLHALRRESARLEAVFESECADNGYGDRWGAYRAEQAGEKWPASVAVAHDAWMAALHRFYAARDGEAGVLGRVAP
jgi:hypothetical protein